MANITITNNHSLEELIQSIETERQCQDFVSITFEQDIENEILLKFLHSIWDFENRMIAEGIMESNVGVNIKNLSIQQRILALSEALDRLDLIDPLFLLNIHALIRKNNTFADSFFQCEEIFINNIVEMLDFQIDLSDKLKSLSKKLCTIYMSLFKSCGIVEVPSDTVVYKIDNLYHGLLLLSDFVSMSGMLQSQEEIQFNDLMLVDNSGFYLAKMSASFVISDRLLNNGEL